MNEQRNDLIIVGALWRKESKDKKVYLTASINEDIQKGANLVCFQNKKKVNDNSEEDKKRPNYWIYREAQEGAALDTPQTQNEIDKINASL